MNLGNVPAPLKILPLSNVGWSLPGLEFPLEAHRRLSHKSIVHISHFDTPFFSFGLLREGFSRFTAKMVNITEKIKE